MKSKRSGRALFCAIALFLVIAIVVPLCSCNGKSELAELSDGAYSVHTVSKDYYDADNVTLELTIVNKNTSYDKATLVIDTKGLFSIDGIEGDNGVYRLPYDDFGDEKYAEGVNETFSLRFNGVSESFNYLTGWIEVFLETEEADEFPYIFFVTDGEHLAFFEYGVNSYYDLCQRFPKNVFLSKVSEDPLYANPYSTGELEMGASVEGIAVTLSSAKRQQVSDAFSLEVAIGQIRPFFEDAAVVIEAEGFSIRISDDASLDTFTREYDSFDSEEYLFVRGCESFENYKIHYANEFAYHESVALTYNQKGASEGKIKFTLQSKNGTLSDGTKMYDREQVSIYYATDGKNIAYSVESEDAAKRALYGELGYFFKVSVPEYFDSLFA